MKAKQKQSKPNIQQIQQRISKFAIICKKGVIRECRCESLKLVEIFISINIKIKINKYKQAKLDYINIISGRNQWINKYKYLIKHSYIMSEINQKPICPLPIYHDQKCKNQSNQPPNMFLLPYYQNQFKSGSQIPAYTPLQKYAINPHLDPIVKIQWNPIVKLEEDPYILKQWAEVKREQMQNHIICGNEADNSNRHGAQKQQDKIKSKAHRDYIREEANKTKNIPKNFGKAIIAFIQKNQALVAKCMEHHSEVTMEDFIRELKKKKKIVHSIRQLRAMWIDGEFPYARLFRQISEFFLRKVGYKYVFSSRAADFNNHLKYRYRILKAIKSPSTFNSIKF